MKKTTKKNTVTVMAFTHCSNWDNYFHIIVFCLGLCLSLLELRKRWKLQKRGYIGNGTIRSLKTILPRVGRYRPQTFYVGYDFEYDQDKAELLVIGYIQSIDNQYKIPKPIQYLILDFYDKYGLQKTVDGTHQIGKQYYELLTEGDSIEIVYDPIQPKNCHIPMEEYKKRGNVYWVGCMIMTVISGCISILGIKFGCMEYVNDGLKCVYFFLFFIICYLDS